MLVAVLASLPVDIDLINAVCPSPFQRRSQFQRATNSALFQRPFKPPRQIVPEIKRFRVASGKVRLERIAKKASSAAIVKPLPNCRQMKEVYGILRAA